MMAGVTAIIPARLASRRFPGKVLAPLHGRPLLYYVWRTVARAKSIDQVAVASSDPEILRAAAAFGAEVIHTSDRHHTGSDRAAEAASKIGGEIVINIQADCLGLRPADLNRLLRFLRASPVRRCVTLARKLRAPEELVSPNTVKVVTSVDGRALWFSRSPLPFLQHVPPRNWPRRFKYLAHIGVYAFRRRQLREFTAWPQSALERAESLEQLRLLEHGRPIHVVLTDTQTISIDSPADLKKLASRSRQGMVL